ncbi:MAG: BatD family protein [Bacteroidota bacterium]
MRASKFLLSLSLIIAFCIPVCAQVKFSTIINDKEVGKDDYLQVQYIVENASSVESLAPPVFNGFTVVSGPMQQTGMSIINGATSKYEGVTYILKPSATGSFTIGGATATVNGKSMHSNSVTVTVTNAASRQSNPVANPFGLALPEEAPEEVDEEYILRKGESAADKIKNNLFVKLDVNKTTCYAGEPVVATYKLYSRLKSESRITKRPSLSQFSVYDMVQPEANNPSVEKLNGKLYNTHIIRKVQLYPLQDGSFDLDPVEVDNTIRFLRLEGSNGKISMQQLINDYMNGVTDGKMEEQQVTLASKPVTITVKALPAEGKPVSFDGAVGKFTISALLPKIDITANETAVFDVILKGQGNLTLINGPPVQWPKDVEAYEPTVKENLDRTVAPISGTKLFEYSFTPKQPGKIIIPPVEFSYFDPAANAYKTIRTDSIVADVAKASKKSNQVTFATDANQSSSAGNFKWIRLLWLLPLLAVAFLALLFNRKKNTPVKNNIAAAPARPVTDKDVIVPADPFEGAKHALAAVNSQLFYKETGKATWHILAEKFNLTSSQLNKPVVIRLLQQGNQPAETIQLLENVLNDCELALYTPVHTENDMRHTLEKAERLGKLLSWRDAVSF